jgi:predicted PurR-regulated permease PerM
MKFLLASFSYIKFLVTVLVASAVLFIIAAFKAFRDQIQNILNYISSIKYNRSSPAHIASHKSLVIKDLFGRLKNLSETYADLDNQESVPIMKTAVDLC